MGIPAKSRSQLGGSSNLRNLFVGFINKDYSMLGSILGLPIFVLSLLVDENSGLQLAFRNTPACPWHINPKL